MGMGLAFIWFGLFFFGGQGVNWFFVAMGGLFFLFGISQYYMSKKLQKFLDNKKG